MGKVINFQPYLDDRKAREWLHSAGIMMDAASVRESVQLAFGGSDTFFRLRDSVNPESGAALSTTCMVVVKFSHDDWEHRVAPRIRHVHSWALKHLPAKLQGIFGIEVEDV